MRIDKGYWPWLDRAGRPSALKAGTFALVLLPGLWMAFEGTAGWLGPKPLTEALHQSGTWAVRLLLLSLAVTPFRRVAQWGKLIAVRRMLGLAVLAYAALHLALYVVDQHGDIVRVATEISLRFYLTVGFVALVGFAVLGATSTDGMIRKIGGKRWQTLHRSVYAFGALALLHFMLQAKLDISQPVLMLGLFLNLMGWRLLQRRGLGDRVSALLGLAVTASLGAAVVEAAWYAAFNRLSAIDVLAANFATDDGLRPAIWVLLAGLAVAAVRLVRLAQARLVGAPGAAATRRAVAGPRRDASAVRP